MVKEHLKEKKLLYRVQVDHDKDAFGELYDLYVEKIYRFVFFKISDRAETEDVVSEIFLKTWNYLINKEKGEVDSFSGFVYQVARNAVIDWYRERKKRSTYLSPEPVEDMEVADEAASSVMETKQDVDRTFAVMKKMKHEYQEILMLRFVEELSIKEIAAISGKGQTAVRVTLHRAVKKMKELLDQENKI